MNLHYHDFERISLVSRKSIQKTEVTRTSIGLPLRKIPRENLRKGAIVLQQRPAT